MVFNYKNFLITMMSVEIMYLGVISSFVFYAVTFDNASASVYALLLLILAASESAIGLGIIIVLYRFNSTLAIKSYEHLGG